MGSLTKDEIIEVDAEAQDGIQPLFRTPVNQLASQCSRHVQAQHQHSDWLLKVKDILYSPEWEGEENKLGFDIVKVPEYLRQPPEEFTPVAWRFGLHNREMLDTSGSEALKLCIPVALGLVGKDWDQFCNFVVDDWKSMLMCYCLRAEVHKLSEDVVKHILALDALFLAVYMDLCFSEQDKMLSAVEVEKLTAKNNQMLHSTFMWWKLQIWVDICKMENQIPFVLIEKAVEYFRIRANPFAKQEVHSTSVLNDGQLQNAYHKKWMDLSLNDSGSDVFITIPDDFYGTGDPFSELPKSNHILEVVYRATCGEGLVRTSDYSEDVIDIPSATTLKDSGIEMRGVAGPLCTMSYENKCLSIPKMNMYDNTVAFIRNMTRYEEYCTDGGCMFHEYIFLMCNLIRTPVDLETLVMCGVIRNACGNKAFDKWITLEEGVCDVKPSKVHSEMKRAINRRCEFKRYRFWSEFNTLFCSRPWLVLSAITVVLVTVATLIQTYASIMGSNRMKPQFP